MSLALIIAVVILAHMVGLFVLRGLVRRYRRLRRLDRAEARVVEAMADGRLASATGEALLQHLEGLRRVCAHGGEG